MMRRLDQNEGEFLARCPMAIFSDNQPAVTHRWPRGSWIAAMVILRLSDKLGLGDSAERSPSGPRTIPHPSESWTRDAN